MVQSNISNNLQLLKSQMLQSIQEIAEEVSVDANEEIVAMQEKETFWNNITFKAIDAIGHNTEDNGSSIKMSVGFTDGNPAEQREGGAREYNKYLAEYKKGQGNVGIHFLGACLNSLVNNFNFKMSNIKQFKKYRATYLGGGQWGTTE